jgi:hypothetical protein
MILSQTKCFNHRLREAVALCPECGRYFCRECVIEHDDRLICAYCLKNIEKSEASSGRFRSVLRLVPAIVGVAILWMFFYLIGKGLLLIPQPGEIAHPTPSQSSDTAAFLVDR